MTKKIAKEAKKIMVVDIWLDSLTLLLETSGKCDINCIYRRVLILSDLKINYFYYKTQNNCIKCLFIIKCKKYVQSSLL